MAELHELVDATRTFARVRKESALGEMLPTLLSLRDGRVVALAEHTDIGVLLGAAADRAAMAYGAEALALVFEGVFPLVETNPLTGVPWGRGEADQVWRDHDGVAKAWVTECQIVSVVTREMEGAASVRPFVLGDPLTWSDTHQSAGRVGVEQSLARALSRPAADHTAVPDPGDRFVAPEGAPAMTPENGRLALDVGGTRSLDAMLRQSDKGHGGAAFVVPSAEAVAGYASQGLMEWQIVVYEEDS
ncbi:hypothetical protein [Nocardioides kribbensis]|uniref:Uncharacterized protein n=1 Tax=Nocardioides kribbensis TaxID=305517 RepID=A0ABV1NTF4_9ACTN